MRSSDEADDRGHETGSETTMNVRRALVLWGTLVMGGLVAPLAASAQDETADFSGAWETSYGLMTLEQDGVEVTGTYSYGGGSGIRGSVEGRRLTFRYQEPAAAGDGWFELADDGQSFTGSWHEDGSDSWHDWTGARSTRGPAVTPATGFSGLFDSTYGRLRLVADGSTVRGGYSHGGGSTIEGTIENGRLTFRYQEPDAAGDGWFELSADEQALEGQWRADGSPTWGAWTATRVHPEPGRVWLVVLEAPWELSLAENEYAFGEMLRAYFERMPHVGVRHRRVYDLADFQRSAAELGYLAEPVALLVASHGIDGQLVVGSETINAEHFRTALAEAPNVFLIHFSSCDTMTEGLPEAIRDALPADRRVAISGYATFVDWAASALIEFLYLDLVLGRGLAPATAAEIVQHEMRFAGDAESAMSPLGAARFRFVQ